MPKKVLPVSEGAIGAQSEFYEWQNRLWKSDFELLARHAHLIFVVPGLSAGVRWELEWLGREVMVQKCVFIMPPSQHDVWHEVQEACRTMGWKLPEPDRNGCLFRIGPDGTCYGVCSFRSLRELDLVFVLTAVSIANTLKETDRIQAEMRQRFRQVFGRDPNV